MWSRFSQTVRSRGPEALLLLGLLTFQLTFSLPAAADDQWEDYLFHDAHFHISNYIQQSTAADAYIEMMGTNIGRSTMFGLPLQQMWSYANSEDFAPYYYLQTDAPLYYYSFVDAAIAMAYLSLPEEQQARLDPMITGFNPTDMYAVDHIRRVLLTFPGVFSGIGEFSIHKEFVSSKIAGEVANLTNPALDLILDFCAEVGMPAILHNDINMPFPKEGQEPYLLAQLKALFERHTDCTIIWAHLGLGRIVQPLDRQAEVVEAICSMPSLSHVLMDISWDEVAKYATGTPEAIQRTAGLFNKHPERFLFGSDCVAPKSADSQLAVYNLYQPVWDLLDPGVQDMICKGNYERVFDEARVNVRAWEEANVGLPAPEPTPTPISGAARY